MVSSFWYDTRKMIHWWSGRAVVGSRAFLRDTPKSCISQSTGGVEFASLRGELEAGASCSGLTTPL